MKRAFTMRELKEHDRLEDRLLAGVDACTTGEVRAKLLVSRRDWRDNGRWPRYYEAREGRVHGSRYCAALSSTTKLTALWWFSGDPVEAVAGSGRRLCRKCFPDFAGGSEVKATACPGSGGRSVCRCGDRGCWQLCPQCGESVLVTPSGVLRRHGTKG